MKPIFVVLIAFMAMASAIPRRDFSSVFSSISTATTTESTALTPSQSFALSTPDTAHPESLNQTIHLGLQRANRQARDDDFSCKGVQYYSSEIDVECVVTKRPAGSSWYYKFDVKIQPTGLAYGKEGLDRWYKHFLESFLDGWDRDFFEDDISSPADWQTTWEYEEIGENNWGWGLWVESTEADSEKFEDDDDPHIEGHLAEHLEEIIPNAVCGDDAGGIYWKHEDKCEIIVKEDKEEEEEEEEDDDADDEPKTDTTNDEEIPWPGPGGGYRGRGG